MWMKQSAFPRELMECPDFDKMCYFRSGFTLRHRMINAVFNYIEDRFFHADEQTIALVIGPTGVGKSHLAALLHEHVYGSLTRSEDVVTELPMIYVEANVPGGSSFSWKDFYEDVLIALGEQRSLRIYGRPNEAGDDLGRRYSTRNRTESELKRDVIKRLKSFKVRYLVVDEIQHIFKYGGSSGEKSLDVLKSLANRAGCKILGLGTYGIIQSIERSSELSRRILEVGFSSYSLQKDEDIRAFEESFLGLLAHAPCEIDPSLIDFVESAFLGSCGCVGILKQWMERALRHALGQPRQMLTEACFKNTRLPGSQLKKIAEDIREGVALFTNPSDEELWDALLGNEPTVVARCEPSTKPSARRPGQRNPVRDKVGR